MSELILHHYWQSPFAHKIRLVLGLIDISWRSVEIPRIPPKPLLIPLTAGYRRTPVLQCGADVFCDTQNIVRAIADLTDDHQLIPASKRAKILMFTDWIDGTVFNLAVRVILTSAMETAPPEFIQDRAGLYFGSNWTPDGLKAQLPGVILQLGAHLKLIDQGLAGSGGFVSRAPSYADISIANIAWFIRGRWENGPNFLKQFPNIERVEREIHVQTSERCEDLTGDAALAIAHDSLSSAPEGVQRQAECSMQQGMRVSIKPQADTSDPPIIGQLRSLDDIRVSIDHNAPEVGDVVVHLPIAGYQIQSCE
tara:strand:+ start:2287 stop:3213 length:927 start_codon:yes stop_codon:yes gene_type:complete